MYPKPAASIASGPRKLKTIVRTGTSRFSGTRPALKVLRVLRDRPERRGLLVQLERRDPPARPEQQDLLARLDPSVPLVQPGHRVPPELTERTELMAQPEHLERLEHRVRRVRRV